MATTPLTLNTGQSALLMADFHLEGMGDHPIVQERGTVQTARMVLEATRQAGVLAKGVGGNDMFPFQALGTFGVVLLGLIATTG